MSDQNNPLDAANKATAVLKRINNTESSVGETANKINQHAQNASEKAKLAQEKANEATNSAEAAKTRASEASNSAATAKAKADEATNNAAVSKTKADEATSNAIIAKTKADETTASANNAKAKENETINSAATAKAKEGEVISSANNAKAKEKETSDSAEKAKVKEKEASDSAANAKAREEEALNSSAKALEKESEATNSAQNALLKEQEATASAESAKTKEEEAAESAKEANRSAKEAAEAHNLSTTAGLAGAFNVKADSAMKRMLFSSFLLLVALVVIGLVGFNRFDEVIALISSLIESDKLLEALVAQILFFVIGAGAPIWLAWMATRMIMRYFQISEDYAYKASLAKAYIGFKKQADGLDPIFEQRLFAAAITQLDANPLRFFENSSHPESPVQDLLQQPFMISAMQNNLGFKDAVSNWMNNRFKTNFYVERVDLLKVMPKDLKKAANDLETGVKDILKSKE